VGGIVKKNNFFAEPFLAFWVNRPFRKRIRPKKLEVPRFPSELESQNKSIIFGIRFNIGLVLIIMQLNKLESRSRFFSKKMENYKLNVWPEKNLISTHFMPDPPNL
jgi:hypothetical protein